MITTRLAGIGFVALLSLCCTARAEVYKIGDSFAGFQAPDQQGVAVTFKAGDASYILLDTPGESGESAAPQDPAWFATHQALLVVNISGLSFLKRDIARSRLKSKPFRTLVLEDKAAAGRFPRQAGKITILVVNGQGAITGIRFAAPGKEVQAAISDNK